MCIGKENICSAMRLRKGTICRNIFSGEKKAAFSDAVGHSMVDDLKEYADTCYTEEAFEKERQNILMHSRLQKSLFCIGRFLKNIIRDRRK